MAAKNEISLEFQVDIIVEPDDGEFYAYCPALKGLHVSGATEEEAVQNATDAARAYLQSLIKHSEPIPLTAAVRTTGAEATGEARTLTQTLEVRVA